MNAILIRQNGGPEQLTFTEAPDPAPGPGQVLIRVAAAGVNFIDVYFRTGLYKADLPFIPGQECAGTVEAVGPDVTGFKPGDRVVHCTTRGAYAPLQAVPAAGIVPVPEGVDLESAAALLLQGMTAHYLSHSTFALQPGHTCLIHAAAGGTGQLLVQMAKARGARVIATAGSDEKAALARQAGADEVIVYTKSDFAAETRRLTDNQGVEVVYDSVGATTFQGSIDSLRPRGMMVTFGNASGPVPEIAPLILSQKGSLFLTRPTLGHYVATREELLNRAAEVFAYVTSGKVKVAIGQRYPLADAAQAHRDLEARRTTGKLLLVP